MYNTNAHTSSRGSRNGNTNTKTRKRIRNRNRKRTRKHTQTQTHTVDQWPNVHFKVDHLLITKTGTSVKFANKVTLLQRIIRTLSLCRNLSDVIFNAKIFLLLFLFLSNLSIYCMFKVIASFLIFLSIE